VDLSITIPIYNAAALIENTLSRLILELNSTQFQYEILLCDDGSSDSSAEILRRVERSFPQVRCFFHDRNLGLGATLRSLWREARGSRVIYVDCDLPFGAEVLPEMIRLSQQFDIVVASRYLAEKSPVGFFRRMSSHLYHLFCQALFRVGVRDIGSGTVVVRKSVLEQLTLTANGFDIHIELFVKARRAGLKLKEQAFPAAQIQPGSFSVIKHGIPVVWATLRLYGWLLRKEGSGV